jgi:dihydrofolate reductase
MMRIVLSDFMSLDGVVQSPGGQDEHTGGGFAHGGWSMPYFEPETMGPAVTETMDGTDALLFGRRTWQTMAAAWPARAGDPFADRMNEIPKYVASRTLSHDDLTCDDLVDEYRLMIEPILLGGGKRVFPCDGRARALELVSATTTGTGVLICTYRRR